MFTRPRRICPGFQANVSGRFYQALPAVGSSRNRLHAGGKRNGFRHSRFRQALRRFHSPRCGSFSNGRELSDSSPRRECFSWHWLGPTIRFTRPRRAGWNAGGISGRHARLRNLVSSGCPRTGDRKDIRNSRYCCGSPCRDGSRSFAPLPGCTSRSGTITRHVRFPDGAQAGHRCLSGFHCA